MNKKYLFLSLGIILILIIIYVCYFFVMPMFGGKNSLNVSCGSEFNKIYKKYADEGKSPDFCLNIDKINVNYAINTEGYKYCFAFNGHEFSDIGSLDYHGRITQISTWIGAAIGVDYDSSSIVNSGPINSGNCVESFSVYTKKNYCSILPFRDQHLPYPDTCIDNLAYYNNDPSLCDQAITSYICYGLLAKKDHSSQYCDKVPNTKIDATDKFTLRQTCVNSAKYLSPNQILENTTSVPASSYGKALSDPKQECLKDSGQWVPCDKINDYLSLHNINPGDSTASQCKGFSTTPMGYGTKQYLTYPNYGCDCGADKYWSFSWNTCVKPSK